MPFVLVWWVCNHRNEIVTAKKILQVKDKNILGTENKKKYNIPMTWLYESVSRSFRTGFLERELHMVYLSATRCSCIAILWANLVSFVAITLRVASQRLFIVVVVYFVIDSVRKLLDTPSYLAQWLLPY
jgi:hypothetical protein